MIHICLRHLETSFANEDPANIYFMWFTKSLDQEYLHDKHVYMSLTFLARKTRQQTTEICALI